MLLEEPISVVLQLIPTKHHLVGDLVEAGMGSTGQPPAASGRDDTYVGGFGSEHPGGALFVFGDGSVRFVPESISMAVYQRHGHRADGELIDTKE